MVPVNHIVSRVTSACFNSGRVFAPLLFRGNPLYFKEDAEKRRPTPTMLTMARRLSACVSVQIISRSRRRSALVGGQIIPASHSAAAFNRNTSASGAAGLMALVPLLKGGDPATIRRAAQQIRSALPGQRMSDAEAILWMLAEARYNKEEFSKEIGRDHMQALIDLIKQSPLYQQAEAEGEAKGRAEGLAAQRATFLKLVSRKHPELLELAASRAERCDNPGQLEAWILEASERDGEALARLLADPPDAR